MSQNPIGDSRDCSSKKVVVKQQSLSCHKKIKVGSSPCLKEPSLLGDVRVWHIRGASNVVLKGIEGITQK